MSVPSLSGGSINSCDSAPISSYSSGGHPPGTFTPYGASGGDYWSIEDLARAGPGSLVVRTYGITYFIQPIFIPLDFGSVASAGASFAIDDLMITGPGTSLSGTMHLQLDGAIGANAGIFGTPSGYTSSQASISFSGSMTGVGFNESFAGSAAVSANSVDGILPWTTSGLLTDYRGGPIAIDVPLTNAPVGTPISMSLNLFSLASARIANSGVPNYRAWSEGISSFEGGLSFVGGGHSVFTLPDGFTVDSVGAGIIDNIHVVPLPAAAWLLGAALLGLFGHSLRGEPH